MGKEVEEDVRVSVAPVVEAPVLAHARLKTLSVVALRLERGVPEVSKELCELLPEELLNLGRRLDEAVDEGLSENGAHGRTA